MKLVIKWAHDEAGDLIIGDDCIVYEDNFTDREWANQVNIMGTYDRLISVGGCTPEQARQQTSYAVDRLRRWHKGDWYYVGCVVTILDDEDEKLADASLWGINSDCGDYKREVESEMAYDALYNLQADGIITSFTWGAGTSFWVVFPDNSVEHLTPEESEDSAYMTEDLSKSPEPIPMWNDFFELESHGDSDFRYRCTCCYTTYEMGELTAEEFESGRCKEESCNYHWIKYVELFAADGTTVAVLEHPTGMTRDKWDILNEVEVNTDYALLTGAKLIDSVPTYKPFNWCNTLYKRESLGWTLR